ncbi:MAG: kinase, partial [Lachnospiraceae bacterium]|nr:kinase [Lachnospiraceae bacterium]
RSGGLVAVNKSPEMRCLVDEAEKILVDEAGDMDGFGRLLDDAWGLKKQIGDGVSTSCIDELYKKGIKAGATGGKLLGAGGGGFLLFYAEPEAHDRIRAAMENLLYIPFRFEDDGTSVIYYAPEMYGTEKGAHI